MTPAAIEAYKHDNVKYMTLNIEVIIRPKIFSFRAINRLFSNLFLPM